jgi:hypothetical protein
MNSNKDRPDTSTQVNPLSNVPVATTGVSHVAGTGTALSRRYENWDTHLFDEDSRTGDVTTESDDVSDSDANPMLEFAEQYFNAQPTQHAGYQSAIIRTVNIVTRKSLSVS